MMRSSIWSSKAVRVLTLQEWFYVDEPRDWVHYFTQAMLYVAVAGLLWTLLSLIPGFPWKLPP